MSKRYGSGIRRGTVERLKLAMGQDPAIASTASELENHPGSPEAYLESIGLTKSDLLRLERHGFAIRGYVPDRAGRKARWIILMEETSVPDVQQT